MIRGDLNLVGISPFTNHEEQGQPVEEWRAVQTDAPAGLFHLWELEERNDLEWEEKQVIESYYAATRSIWGDMKILMKSLFARRW